MPYALLIASDEEHLKAEVGLLEAEALVEVVGVGATLVCGKNEFVAARAARPSHRFFHQEGAKPLPARALMDRDIFHDCPRLPAMGEGLHNDEHERPDHAQILVVGQFESGGVKCDLLGTSHPRCGFVIIVSLPSSSTWTM